MLKTFPAQSMNSPAARGHSMSYPVSASWTATDLYRHWLRDVYHYVSRRVRRREDAEDVAAEVFEAAFRGLSRLRVVDDPRVWLIGIARRKVADHLRRAVRRRELLDADSADGYATASLSAEGGDPATD